MTDVINLHGLATDLALVVREAEAYGLSKSLRDRLNGAVTVLPVIEAARDRKHGPRAA